MTFKRFFKNLKSEIIRDLTSFGDPFVLVLVSLMILGLNFKLLAVFFGLIIVESFGSLIKFFYYKKRPREEKYANFFEKINASSFPSLHSARSSFVFISLFFIFNNPFLKFVFLLIPLIVGFTRITLKKHYLIDIIGGYIIGLSFSFLTKSLGFFN